MKEIVPNNKHMHPGANPHDVVSIKVPYVNIDPSVLCYVVYKGDIALVINY